MEHRVLRARPRHTAARIAGAPGLGEAGIRAGQLVERVRRPFSPVIGESCRG
jgi:hypothetical protein